jgi:hypothetical protein
MPWATLRPISAAALASAFGFLLPIASGCGTDAVGIEDCRQIEQARCELGAACGVVTDVDACKRFFRDHCLHGMALEDSPGTTQVKACTQAIRAGTACAQTQGPEALTAACQEVQAPALDKVCEVVGKPEESTPCRFLVPAPPTPPVDAASDSGAG